MRVEDRECKCACVRGGGCGWRERKSEIFYDIV